MSAKQLVNENDIINTYKVKGSLRSYNSFSKYTRFTLLGHKNISGILYKLNLPKRTASHWLNNERTPIIAQTISALKNGGCLPLSESDKLARLVGYIHGDGWITEDLRTVGMSSGETSIINDFNSIVNQIFHDKARVRVAYKSGERTEILGIKRKATKNIFKSELNNTGIARSLYCVSGIRGLKKIKDYLVPSWIMNGKESIKREFLTALFDCELSNFTVNPAHGNNILRLKMEMVKAENNLKSLDIYFKQIKTLLQEFRVESKIHDEIFLRKDRLDRNLYRKSITINNSLYNIRRFINELGFIASKYKKDRQSIILKLVNSKVAYKRG